MSRYATRDTIAGLICLMVSVWLCTLTFGLPQSPFVPVGPGFYPRLVLILSAVLSVALTIQGIVAARKEGGGQTTERRNYLGVFIAFVLFFLYVGLLPYLGYRIATFVFVVALGAQLEPPRSLKQWGVLAITALVTSAATYIVFQHYLTVLLPRGAWTEF